MYFSSLLNREIKNLNVGGGGGGNVNTEIDKRNQGTIKVAVPSFKGTG